MTTPASIPRTITRTPVTSQQRQDDSLGARAQSAALTDYGVNPHATINEMIDASVRTAWTWPASSRKILRSSSTCGATPVRGTPISRTWAS